MFIGIDHGTTGIRFASTDGSWFELSRKQARDMSKEQIVDAMLTNMHVSKGDIGLIAVTYSMGDGISKITPIGRVKDRGLISWEGAGVHIGGGTNVYDAIASLVILKIVNQLVPLRVEIEDEDAGLDLTQHGERAYTE